MVTLLQSYSLSDILIFIIILGLAIKSTVSFYDWAYERLERIFSQGNKKINEKEQLEQRLRKGSQIMNALEQSQEKTDQALQDLTKKINLLIESDKDDIRASITREHHHFCYELGWIDDFSLDCLQRRFRHYADEGGNSFIQGFMNELRALPKKENIEFQEKKGE